MNRKLVIICISVLGLLLAAIAAGVAVLYSGGEGADSSPLVQEHSPVLKAIPSDAAAVMSFSSLEKCACLLDDPGTPLPALVCCQSNSLRTFLGDIRTGDRFKDARNMRAAVYLHFSGKFIPLLVVDAGTVSAADTAEVFGNLISLAGKHSLHCTLEDSGNHGWFLCSSSETLLKSSVRHLSEGQSILADDNFKKILDGVSDHNVIFLNNAYAQKLMTAFFQSGVARKASFFKNAADWTALAMRDCGSGEYRFTGDAVYGSSPSYFMNLLAAQPKGECNVLDVLPSGTVSALSLTCTKDDGWREGYEKYIDASMRLRNYRMACDTLKKNIGEDPLQWIRNCREVAAASWKSEGGNTVKANFYRLNKNVGTGERIVPWNGGGMAAVLFGAAFELEDETCCVKAGNWLVTGGIAALKDWMAHVSSGDMLKADLDAMGISSLFPDKDCAMAAYWSGKDAVADAGSVFREPMLSAVASSVKDADYAPMAVSFSKGRFTITWKTLSDRPETVQGESGQRVQVEVPSGPFTVKNCLSGKNNTFYQNENLYLCLKDEKGKGLWGVPFSEPICGRVENIDYYANGKIQFLFAAGSKIYLITRLGGFVTGFPVDLRKEVLIGPAAYDFSGAYGYNIMVLHTDNTVEMYNLKGRKPEKWQGITATDTITGLPELLKKDSGKYWKVPTAGGVLYFDFWGGKPIKEKEMK